MKKFITILAIILKITFVSGQDFQFHPVYEIVFDSSNAGQLLRQCSREVPKNIQAFWTPSSDDIDKLENSFEKVYDLKSNGCCIEGSKIRDLNLFAFQFAGVIIEGHKYIYINAFPQHLINDYKKAKIDIKKNAVVICDGGKGFWGVLFDVNNEEFLSLTMNGMG